MTIPAAQYLRMSTDKQEYSIVHQSTAIRVFAAQHGFEVVQSYVDAGRSGVVLKGRKGLRQLLEDVINGEPAFKAVLVYDVSRWGRFQDYDEAAHYEFICRENGVQVLYCAEPFSNDNSQANALVKALKRTMAGEFSRQLAIRVFERKKALAEKGFRVGGSAPLGFRRVLLSRSGKKLRTLQFGFWKYGPDRVILRLGPRHEVRCVRQIFEMLLRKHMSCGDIAAELNKRKIKHHGCLWNRNSIYNLLTNPICKGVGVWGRTSQKMHTPKRTVDQSSWTTSEHVVTPIVSNSTFLKAQNELRRRAAARHWSEERIVESVRRLQKHAGKLSMRVMENASGIPSSRTIRQHFGSYQALYERLGVSLTSQTKQMVASHRATLGIRAAVQQSIIEACAPRAAVGHISGARRTLLVDGCIPVSLLVCRSVRNGVGWQVVKNDRERDYACFVCLLDRTNTRIEQMLCCPAIHWRQHARRVRIDDDWLRAGTPIGEFGQFCAILYRVADR